VIGALASDSTLLALKVAFLAGLYVFILFMLRSATKDIGTAPQESIMLSPRDAAELRASAVTPTRRLLVLSSPVLRQGSTVELEELVRLGRGAENGVDLDGDEFVSSRHATIDPRSDGLWIEDAGSTNGTFVNGSRVTSARLLLRGDVVRIGQTELQVEA
jgi:pSer/pThr/pTyr-binding forkhead associated (FHA) protein